MALYKKGNRLYVDYYLPGGKRKREAVKILGVNPSKINFRDAQNAHSIRKAELAEGKFDILKTHKPIPFENLMDEYLNWAKENHKAPERDRAAAKPLLSYFKGKDINFLSLWHVEKYKSIRKAEGRKSETINKELGVLRRMFNLALTGALKTKISKNPISGLRFLKVTKFQPRVLKDSEFKKLFGAASTHFKPILLCAYMTGMRRSEIARLKWEHVDLEDRYLCVTETKNNESRTIPIQDDLFKLLAELKETSKCEYVFTTHEGKPYSHITVWKRAWNTALRKSRIERCRFHDLRHTFVSNLIVREKEDFATVMDLSGHRDITMLKRYSHTREEAKKSAISKLGKHLDSATMNTFLDTKDQKLESINTNIVGLTSHN